MVAVAERCVARQHPPSTATGPWSNHRPLPGRCCRSNTRSAHGGDDDATFGASPGLATDRAGPPHCSGRHKRIEQLSTRQPTIPLHGGVRCLGGRGARDLDLRRRQTLGSAGSNPSHSHVHAAVILLSMLAMGTAGRPSTTNLFRSQRTTTDAAAATCPAPLLRR